MLVGANEYVLCNLVGILFMVDETHACAEDHLLVFLYEQPEIIPVARQDAFYDLKVGHAPLRSQFNG
jgi:hypothetical protein